LLFYRPQELTNFDPQHHDFFFGLFHLTRTQKALDIMPMENFSSHQQKIIKSYYKNRDNIALQRVQELVTELYLSEGKKREKVWDLIASNLEKMSVPPDRISHLRAQNKPELVAQLVQTLV